MMKAAVLGSPISHSLSPLLHNHAYKVLGFSGTYSAIEVKQGELAQFIESAQQDGMRGLSLTMPLKEEVLNLSLEIDDKARRIGSANTVLISQESVQALSTDLLAFQRLITPAASDRVAVLGGGGTARALLGAMDGTIDSVDVYVRNPEKAQALHSVMEFSRLEIRVLSEISPEDVAQSQWFISTLPAGVSDQLAAGLSSSPHNFHGLHFCEVLYHPWPTDLLAQFKASGAATVDGLDLLVEQALDQISLMTEVTFDYQEMRTELLSVGLSSLRG